MWRHSYRGCFPELPYMIFRKKMDPSSAYPRVTKIKNSTINNKNPWTLTLKTFELLKSEPQRTTEIRRNCMRLVRNKGNFYTWLKNDKVVNKAGHNDGRRMEKERDWSFETETRERKIQSDFESHLRCRSPWFQISSLCSWRPLNRKQQGQQIKEHHPTMFSFELIREILKWEEERVKAITSWFGNLLVKRWI